MSEFAVLDVVLHDKQIGTITHLPGDRNLFAFNTEYIDDTDRATLSLSYEDILGELITNIKSTRTKLTPFFSNLLPEGHMRDYLASQANVNPQREFYLLAALGKDLPGALRILPSKSINIAQDQNNEMQKLIEAEKEGFVLHFSLAGVQLKFSAVLEKGGAITIPVDGVGGSWIVKLPSSAYAGVPENEYAMLELARRIGINVPITALVPMNQIHGLPKNIGFLTNHAFIIKRFDRAPEGGAVHIEDFAQVFGVYPEEKYKAASYRNIVEVIWSKMGEKGLVEFIRRFVFNALIGNGDMHLKNWSLIYPDKINPELAPAYDYVSTIPYLPMDQLALTFVDSKAFSSLDYLQFKRFADKARLPESIVLDTARKTVVDFKRVWKSIQDLPLDKTIIDIIENHFRTVPLYRS